MIGARFYNRVERALTFLPGLTIQWVRKAGGMDKQWLSKAARSALLFTFTYSIWQSNFISFSIDNQLVMQ